MASRVAELAIKMTVEDDSQAGFSSVSRSIQRLRSSAGSELSGIAQVASRAGAALKEGISNGATFALGAIGAMARGAQSQIGKIINSVFSLKTALIGIATGALMKGAWDWLIAPNIQLENMRMTIETLVGDAEQAGRAIDFMMKEALRPGFKPEEVYQAGQMLVPFAKDEQGRFNQEMFEQMIRTAQILKASAPGKTLEDAAYALREALTGDWISLQDRFNIPRSMINDLKEAYGVAAGGAEVTAESVDDLRTKQRDLLWQIEELNLAMQEGERVQLGRVTSVTKQSAADLKQQHRMIQLREELEKVNTELANQEAALAGAGEGASEMETNMSIVNDALDRMGYGFDLVEKQAGTTSGIIDTLKGRFGELLRIMGVDPQEKIKEALSTLATWITEHWDELVTFAKLIGEKIAGGIETMATWIANIDWEGVGSSLKSWGEGFAGVATFLGEVLKIINKWPPWAKSLLIGGLALQATTGLPGALAGTAGVTVAPLAKMALGGGATKGGAAAGAGLGLGTVASGVGAIAAGAIAAAELIKRTPQYQAMSQEEKVRRALRMQPGVRMGEGYERYMGAAPVNVTVEPGSFKFDFHGTVSPAERQAIMEDMAQAIDDGFVQPLTRRLEDGFRR